MRVLWLCNIVLPDFCEEFGLRRNVFGGWLTGMLSELEKLDNIEVGLIFPIIDKQRLKNGVYNKHHYYSIHSPINSYDYINYSEDMVEDLKKIINDFAPDIVHIWGTEYPHTGAMIEACEKLNLLERTVINIQGIISVCAKYYFVSIPDNFLNSSTNKHVSIETDKKLFIERGKIEVETLKKVYHVVGRTDWDEACTRFLNPDVNYHYCNEILRNEFYEYARQWSYDNCDKYSIFVSQASYPIKGLHFLLEAMPIIREKFPDAHIYIGGMNVTSLDNDGEIRPYGEYLNTLINKYDLQDKITFVGMMNSEEMCKQYLKANIFVSASSIENSPNSVCEAMMLGVPVVASNVGGVNSIITHKENGFLYQFDAPYMLAHYIMKIFEDKNLARKLSNNAAINAKKINDKEQNCKQNVDIYFKILEKSN